MLNQGHGSIVNMGSIFGLVGSATSPALTASKHGVIGLTKSAALAYARAGIQVNAVCLSFIDSPMLDRLFAWHPEYKDPLVARHPIMWLGSAEEVAAAVIWLCSDAAAFITGQALAVDGGYVAQ
jgi:NAD(P)-dependent dehydrogenase (short-subunit alcohol dehydrogenase family)